MQRTLRHTVSMEGIGLHSGKRVSLRVVPSGPNTGIVFRRTDLTGPDTLVVASWSNVVDTRLNTQLGNSSGVTVGTVEHLMAALAGLGIHNAMVEIDGQEVPVLDGSSRPFTRAFLSAGLMAQDAPLAVWQVVKPVEMRIGNASAILSPLDGFRIDFDIDFPAAAVGRQSIGLDMRNGSFVRELADCRTFCMAGDIDALRAQNLALGGSLANAVVVDGDRVLSPGGFRRENECVRHKALDALGDLALAGAPILGHYRGVRAGHGVTNALLRSLFATEGAVRPVVMADDAMDCLPGWDLTPYDLAIAG